MDEENEIPMVHFWEDKRIEDCDREELLECIRFIANQLSQEDLRRTDLRCFKVYQDRPIPPIELVASMNPFMGRLYKK